MFLNSIIDFYQAQGLLFWLMGSLSTRAYLTVAFIWAYIIFGFLWLWAKGLSLNLITLGEEAAMQQWRLERFLQRLRRNQLPQRHLRINRRELKQVYHKYKPKKRTAPPPEPFEPEDQFLDFVHLLDPLAPQSSGGP